MPEKAGSVVMTFNTAGFTECAGALLDMPIAFVSDVRARTDLDTRAVVG